MDRKELIKKLQPFLHECKSKGYPLRDLCLEEAYPGVVSTSYIVQVVAKWVDELGSSSQALGILTDILWDTVDEQTRRHIFALYILDNQDMLHSTSDPIHEQAEEALV